MQKFNKDVMLILQIKIQINKIIDAEHMFV